jgi:hypothetical protein
VIINPTGRVIWALLSTPRTVDEIAAHLVATFCSVSPEQAAQDAAQFIQALLPDFMQEVNDDA